MTDIKRSTHLLVLDHALGGHRSLHSLDGGSLDVVVIPSALESAHEVDDGDGEEAAHKEQEAHEHGPAWVGLSHGITLKERINVLVFSLLDIM